jgi:hypothetical protein
LPLRMASLLLSTGRAKVIIIRIGYLPAGGRASMPPTREFEIALPRTRRQGEG